VTRSAPYLAAVRASFFLLHIWPLSRVLFLAQLAGEPLSPTKILAREKLIIALGFLIESWSARTCSVQLHVILPSDGALTYRPYRVGGRKP
jgi:hypothetical protein